MLNSVRFRLTAWYTTLLALILSGFAGGVYAMLSSRFHAELEHRLHSTIEVMASSLRHEIQEHEGREPGERIFRDVLMTVHQASFPTTAITVRSGSRVIAEKPGASGEQKLVVTRATVPGGEDYVISASEPIGPTLAQLAGVRAVLYIAVPFTLALAAGCGYVLARKSLAPVVHMASEVERMTARSLGEQLTVVNPNDELGKLAQTFNGLLARLSDSFEKQRRFMADASHELRTPIAVSRTAAEVTLSGEDRRVSDYREALALIAAQMLRLTRVVNDMFMLARADSGAKVVQRRMFYLNDVLEEALASASQLARPKGIAIHASPFLESPYTGDEDFVRQLILILLDNAIKYTPAGGRIDLALEPGYRITVADTGAGIPIDAQGHIFDRFFRVDKSRSRTAANYSGGAGLGLAIARWIAEAHNGSVALVSSTPGKGSVFATDLPYAIQPGLGG